MQGAASPARSRMIPLWYIDTLSRSGGSGGSGGSGVARNRFDAMQESCIRRGLLQEDIDADAGEHRGSFPRTCTAMVIEGAAMRMSATPKAKS